jgi:hypothetical protein
MGLLTRGEESGWRLGLAANGPTVQRRLSLLEVDNDVTRSLGQESPRMKLTAIPEGARPHMTALIEEMESHRRATKAE